MRKRIFQLIELATDDDKASKIYDIFMFLIIIASLVPLAFKEDYIV